MPAAVLAAEPGAGDADKAVAPGVFLAADRHRIRRTGFAWNEHAGPPLIGIDAKPFDDVLT